jgi:PilZ domain-containing protein
MLTLENLCQVNFGLRFRYLPDTPTEKQRFIMFRGEAVTVMSFPVPKHRRLSGRRSDRVATRAPATLLLKSENGQTACQANAIDTSPHGVRIQTNCLPLVPGQTVEVIMTEDQKCSARGRVVWVRPSSSDRTIQLGLEILSP